MVYKPQGGANGNMSSPCIMLEVICMKFFLKFKREIYEVSRVWLIIRRYNKLYTKQSIDFSENFTSLG